MKNLAVCDATDFFIISWNIHFKVQNVFIDIYFIENAQFKLFLPHDHSHKSVKHLIGRLRTQTTSQAKKKIMSVSSDPTDPNFWPRP